MALEEGATTSVMIKLDSSNYSLWKPMMEDILYCKDLYEPIVKDKIPIGVTEEELRVLNRKVVGMIRLYINHNIFHHVANDTNAYEMWQKLESMYERKTTMNKAAVIKRLAKFEYRDGSNVIEHLNVFQCHINQISAMKINFEDELQALLLLSSMPDSWNTLVVSVSNSAPDGKLTLEMVKNNMLNEEAIKRGKGDASSSNAYVDESHCKHDNRGQCKVANKNEQKGDNGAAMTAECEEGEDYLVVEDEECYSVVRDDAMSWVVDLGASFHITSHKEYFTSYTSGITGQECLMTFAMEVILVQKWKLAKGSLIVAQGSKQGRLDVTKIKLCNDVLTVAGNDTSVEFWHKRLGHMSEKGMHALARMEFLPELKGKDASYKQLKVFGCKAFVHIPRDERPKLDSKTKQCIYLSSPSEEFGYKLWDSIKNKTVRSRDVVFIEDETIQDIGKPEKPKATTSTPHVDMDPVNPPLVHDDHGGDDDAEDSDDATDQGSTSMGHDQPSDEEQDDDNPPDSTPVQQLRISGRDPVPSTKYPPHQYVLSEPSCYEEAVADEHKNDWSEAMQDEMKSLYENDTFELVSLPKGKKALKNKWVYRVKIEEHNSHPRYKARLVVKGFIQKKGINFDEIFSSVVKMSSIRVVLGIAATMDLEIEQLDVKTTFLHCDLEEEIYMEQPEGFVVAGKEHQVCRLKKILYGLNQAPRQ
ncbi:hypothetical protein QYE76_070318 [Lolium multiflorum]|uniref:Gag-pol polyprotein n=1 Tax=Lolium multiflorum TaxID=4521 RepID=A0AAD8SJK7_LOLMU|nr:hypothetical protein QYE76_070318 [Lolium multiflorum]